MKDKINAKIKEYKEKIKTTFSKENMNAFFKETIDTVVFVIVAVVIIRFFLGELRWIPSGSMRMTLVEKDRVFVEKISKWYKRAPQRGDVVVFYPPDEKLSNTPWALFARYTGIFCNDIAYIKRIIGLPGETLEIKKDDIGRFFVSINGKRLQEEYIFSPTGWTECSETVNCGPIKIPEGEYFMMGDNRGNSQDSRYWGTLKEDRIIGRSALIFWPLNRIKFMHTIKNYNLK